MKYGGGELKMTNDVALVLKRKDADEWGQVNVEFYLVDADHIVMKGNVQTYSDEDELREMLIILLNKFLREKY